MPDEQAFPIVPRLLLERLVHLFPITPADPTKRMREVWMQAGEQRIITKLKHEYTKQTKPIKDDE